MKKKIDIIKYTNEELLTLSMRLQKAWRNSAIIWTIADYAFTIISFITSVIVIFLQASNISGSLLTFYTIVFTSISSTFVVVSFCINPRKHKMVYRRAFDIINTAVIAGYLSSDENVYKNLAKSIIIGEKIIASSLEVETYDDDNYFIKDLCNVEK